MIDLTCDQEHELNFAAQKLESLKAIESDSMSKLSLLKKSYESQGSSAKKIWINQRTIAKLNDENRILFHQVEEQSKSQQQRVLSIEAERASGSKMLQEIGGALVSATKVNLEIRQTATELLKVRQS